MFLPTASSATDSIKQLFIIIAVGFTLSLASTLCTAETLSGDPRAGSQTYNAVCKGCHSVSIAPTLRGILDRPIASIESFTGYSDGLKAKQSSTWTEENLNAFLINPGEFAPGTLMIQTIPDAQQRADLIAFLKALPPPRR